MSDLDDELVLQTAFLKVPPLGALEMWGLPKTNNSILSTELHMSPYGTFTPITVRSYSLSADADVE